MNNDFPTDPREALEISLTALVLGELTADQAVFLRDAIARDPELAQRYERLKQTVELVRITRNSAVEGTPVAAPALKLSPRRREQLLQSFKTVEPKQFARAQKNQRSWLVPLSIAAILVVSCGLILVLQSNLERPGMLSTQLGREEVLHRRGQFHSYSRVQPVMREPQSKQKGDELGERLASSKTQIALPHFDAAQVSRSVAFSKDSGTLKYNSSTSSEAPPIETNFVLPMAQGFGGGGLGGGEPAPAGAVWDVNSDKVFRREYQRAAGKPLNDPSEGENLVLNAVPAAVGPVTGLPVQLAVAPETAFAPIPTAGHFDIWSLTNSSQTASESAARDDQTFAFFNGAGWLAKPIEQGKLRQQALADVPSIAFSAENTQRIETLPAQAQKKPGLNEAPLAGDLSGNLEEKSADRVSGLQLKARSLNRSLAELDKEPKDVEKKQSFGYEVSPQAALAWSAEQTTVNLGFLYSLKNHANGLPSTTGSHADQAFTFSAGEDYKFSERAEQNTTPPKEASLAQLQVENRGYHDNDTPLQKPSAVPPVPQPEILTSENAFSTFSLNVSDVSFKLAAASLEKGVMPDPASIRVEEFINAFDYRDPEPGPGVPIEFTWERSQYPFAQNRDLLRFSLKTAAQGRQAGRPLNLVLLLDNSGSMERADRVRIIQEALRVLAAQLQSQDIFSVVTFARTARLWVDGIPGNQAAKVAEELSGLAPQGGTNLEEAMNLAYQTALRHYLPNGANRIVLLTDGAANLGNVDPDALKQKVEMNRRQGVAFDCFGIGWEGYNDDLLEVLTRNGDGRYGFINTPEEAASGFANQLAGALHVAAADVKVQVEFNPNRVTAYRQIGYAKHQLTKEQFHDNTVDAAEIGAAESGNALYVIEVNPNGEGPIAAVRVRYKVPGTVEFREREWPVPYTGRASALQQGGPALRLAETASAFGEWLSQSPYAAEVTPDALLGYLNGIPEMYGADARPKTLEWMIRQVKSLSGK